ncbi:hypothetical protein KEM48_008369 [Puccinia striiformis f. sp. tritici PST-130]|nr:hypothetical protein KEM48_008369 [Puccinia striiformis f. sp. tritici PST-130]
MEDTISQSDAEKIRLKRIAKLQALAPADESKELTVSYNTSSLAGGGQNSSYKAAPKQPPASRVVVGSSSNTNSNPAVTSLSPDEFRKWEHGMITRIFKITLDKEVYIKYSSDLIYLEELRNEIEEEEPGSTKLLTVDIADRILIARLWLNSAELSTTSSADPMIEGAIESQLRNQNLFEYLTSSCTIDHQNKGVLISYIGLYIQEPTLIPGNESTGTDELIDLFINPSPSNPLIQHKWTLIHELSQRFDNDGLEEVIGPVLMRIAMDTNLLTSKWHIGAHEWRIPVRTIEDFLDVKPIARILPNLPTWMPISDSNDNGRRIEFFWLLGPILSLSTFPDRVPTIASEYFSNSKERPHADLESATKGLQSTLNSLQLSLFNIFDRIVRSGPGPRESVLNFWAKIIQFNQKRAAIQVDKNRVASDGTIINTQAVLLQFAAPFLDSQFSKIDKVDPLYFKRSTRLNIREEAKINASLEESESFLGSSSSNPEPVNFISEIFFLNVAIFRLGILTIAKNWNTKAREIEDMKKELDRAQADRRWDGTPHEAARKASLEKFKKEISDHESRLVAYEVQMCDPEFLSKCNSFCSFVMTWCIKMVDPLHQHPEYQSMSIRVRMLPEYVLEDVIEFYSFISRHSPGTLLQSAAVIDELLTFTLVFLTTPYLKNYHLKSKFIEILYYNTLSIPNRKNGILGDSLDYHPLALAHLMPALMQIYVEVEITGSHTQFYDKFYSRRYIALILRKVWDNQTHRGCAQKESLTESFIRFANLLMNDVTYLLDDTLGQLQEAHRIESMMADEEAWQKATRIRTEGGRG